MAVNKIFQQLARLIEEKTERTGRVDSLHGVVEEQTFVPNSAFAQQWYALTIPASQIPTLNEFLSTFTYEGNPVVPVSAVNGVLSWDKEPGTAVLLMTTAWLQSPRTIPIRVRGNGSDLALYVSDRAVANGVSSISYNAYLPAGYHRIATIIYEGDSNPSITLPANIRLLQQDYTPAAPAWVDVPTLVYTDPAIGTIANEMSWGNDPRAAEWQVYRALPSGVGEITAATEASGVVSFTVDSYLDTLDLGDAIYTAHYHAGTVVDITLYSGTQTTDIDVVAGSGSPTTMSEWINDDIFQVTTTFDSIARIKNGGEDIIRFTDPVVPSQLYVYKVTALGIAGSESPFSADGWVLSNDETPPGYITNASGEKGYIYSTVLDDTVTIVFIAPEDTDYAGVKVYGPYASGSLPDTFNPSGIVRTEYGLPGVRDQVTFQGSGTVGDYFYLATFDTIGNTQTVSGSVSWIWSGSVPVSATGAGYRANIDIISSSMSSISLQFYTVDDNNNVLDPTTDLSSMTLKSGSYSGDISSFPGITGPDGNDKYNLTVNRGLDFSDRHYTLEATTTQGYNLRADTVIDWDFWPEIVSTTQAHLLDGSNKVTGWKINWSVDDDTDSITLTDESDTPLTNDGTLTLGSGTITYSGSTYFDTSVGKVGVLNVTQGPGEYRTIKLKPYSSTSGTGFTGNSAQHTLARPPRTLLTTRSLDAANEQITLTTIPSSGTLTFWDVYVNDVKDTDKSGSGTPPLTYTLLRHESSGTEFRYWSELPNVPVEEENIVFFDADTQAQIQEFTMTQVGGSGSVQEALTASVLLDDDTAFARIYTKPSGYPTGNGDLEGSLNDDFLRGTLYWGEANDLTHNAYGSAVGSGQIWYGIAVAHNSNGIPQHRLGANCYISTSGSGPQYSGYLSNVTVVDLNDPGPTNKYHRITWNHSAGVTSSWTIDIDRRIGTEAWTVGWVTGRDPTKDSESGTSTYTIAGDTDTIPDYGSYIYEIGNVVIHNPSLYSAFYKVHLKNPSGTLVDTYFCSRNSYIEGSGVY